MTPTDPAALCPSRRDGYTCVLPLDHAGEHRALGSEQDSYSQPRRWNDGDPRVRTIGQADPAASRSGQAGLIERLTRIRLQMSVVGNTQPWREELYAIEQALSAPCGACAEKGEDLSRAIAAWRQAESALSALREEHERLKAELMHWNDGATSIFARVEKPK